VDGVAFVADKLNANPEAEVAVGPRIQHQWTLIAVQNSEET
jgi:hypothetical protein